MRHRRRVGGGGHGGGGGGHDDRPWVLFMIDCFMLIVQFFVLNFKFKVDDAILPQKLPPGGTVPAKAMLTSTKEMMPVHVSREGGTPTYLVQNSRKCSLHELTSTMASVVSSGKNFQVRVSYEKDVPWADVIAVFNECTKLKVEECGLVPLRGDVGPTGS